MAVQMIFNDRVEMKSVAEARAWGKDHPANALRSGNRQIDPDDIEDGMRVTVVQKASGNN